MVQLNDKMAYRELVSYIINRLLCTHYYKDSKGLPKVLNPLTQKEIATAIGVTPTVISRAYNGVTSLAGESFYLLCKLHDSTLNGICDKVLNF